MSESNDALLRRALLAWYVEHRRDLPWRHAADPYAVWISEVMLQQTRVATVIPYFERWMARFPDARSLAEADEQDVLRAWQGLGYYRRARNLQRAAREVVARHGGRLPDTVDALRELPGIGPYTAGAIASIAFGRPAPIVDGNVIRVLARVARIGGDPSRSAVLRRLWQLAERLVDPHRPGDFNQALMELGATVCTPTSPACGACPIQGLCEARAQGETAEYPGRKAPTKVRVEHHVAARIRDASGAVLLAQRPADGLLADLWEPPLLHAPPAPEGHGARRELLAQAFPWTSHWQCVGSVTHVFSHRRYEVEVWEGLGETSSPRIAVPSDYVELAWNRPERGAEARPLSRLARRVLAARGDDAGPQPAKG